MEKEKMLMEVAQDQEFLAKILAIETAEEVQVAFKEDKGIEISIEEINAIHNAIIKRIENGGELSESDLEDVAGGSVLGTIAGALGIFAGALGIAGAVGGIINDAIRTRW